MSKKLAIQGHEQHGDVVINILKMLGGTNYNAAFGNNDETYYFINEEGIIDYDCTLDEDNDYLVFSLEEFLEKYPFKIGDIVDRTLDYVSCVIDNMRWNSEKCCVEYHLNFLNGSECGWHVSECLYKPDNKDSIIGTKIETTGFMQLGKTVAVCFNKENYENEVELQLGDYEIEVRDGKTYAVLKKPKYPTTYEECFNEHTTQNTLGLLVNKTDALYNLLICRNAYWKIAGKEMGLGKPWEPDWTNYNEYKYCLYITEDVITKGIFYNDNKILSFPTEEIRDTFYENFKDLIEACKELL